MVVVAADDRTRRLLRRARLGSLLGTASAPVPTTPVLAGPRPDGRRPCGHHHRVGTLTVRAATRARGRG